MERENDLHHLGHSCPEVLCPKSRNQRMGICCPLILSPRVEYLHHLDDSVFKIVFFTENDPRNEACISPFTWQRKNKRKTCDLFTAGLFMSLFFLTLFKPKPCVRCDFHVVIIFMAPMSCAASLHQTSFWTLRAYQMGVEQSCV